MENTLGNIISKGRHMKFKGINDIMHAVSQYISKKKGKVLEFLIEVLSTIDSQIVEIESSSENGCINSSEIE
jgi:predicted transcriptional regulator